jgi:hypothetical protein
MRGRPGCRIEAPRGDAGGGWAERYISTISYCFDGFLKIIKNQWLDVNFCFVECTGYPSGYPLTEVVARRVSVARFACIMPQRIPGDRHGT